MLSSRFAGIPISSSTIDEAGVPQLLNRGELTLSAVTGPGGRLHFGMVAGIKSVRWPTSNRNPRPDCVGIRSHFHQLGEIVESNGGYIDNFIGDALMALFGVGGDKSAPFRSVKAAVEMLQANDRMAPYMEATYGHAFPIGIGVHYGEAVIGTLGSSGKENGTCQRQ